MMTARLSGGKTVDLVKNGAKVPVTYANLDEYCRLTVQTRLNEANDQIKWIKDGIDATLKESLLRFFTWRELEHKVIGDAEIKVEQLASMTSYTKCDKDHETIKMFWSVFESLTNEERQRYLQFVWGRTRLPLKEMKQSMMHNIIMDDKKSVDSMPKGQTCFFQLTLPCYQSAAQLKQKLVYAFTHCVQIDGDNEGMAQNDNVDEALLWEDQPIENDSPVVNEDARVDG